MVAAKENDDAATEHGAAVNRLLHNWGACLHWSVRGPLATSAAQLANCCHERTRPNLRSHPNLGLTTKRVTTFGGYKFQLVGECAESAAPTDRLFSPSCARSAGPTDRPRARSAELVSATG